LVECRRPSTRSCFDVDFCGGFFACILHGSASLKTSPPRRKRVRARIKLFCELQGQAGPEESNKKFAEIINVPRMLQVLVVWRCEPVRAGGRLRLDDKRALPLGLQLAPRLCPSYPTSTRSPSLNSLGMTAWSRHALVWAWYLFRACRAKTRSPSMRSFEVGSSTLGTADGTVRGDPCFISCGVMASDP
jgi:hypothetical protein